MTSSVDKQGVVYTLCSNGNAYYVGASNISIIPTGHYNDVGNFTVECPSSITTVTIPEKINGKPVLEIGCRAFSKLLKLETVEIKAKLTQINQFAFYGCCSLTNISIPSSVTFIGYGAISAIKSNYNSSDGILTVKFEPNASVAKIKQFAIEKKEHIIIYYCGYHKPEIDNEAIFYGAQTKIVFSPIELNWGGILANPDPSLCHNNSNKQKITCRGVIYFRQMIGFIHFCLISFF